MKRKKTLLLVVGILIALLLVLAGCKSGGSSSAADTPNQDNQQVVSSLSTIPGYGEKGVPLDTIITVTFTKPVDPNSVTSTTFTLRDANNNTIAGNVACETITAGSITMCMQATFTPSVNLNFNTTYNATIAAGVKDYTGAVLLASDYSWSFSTTAFSKCYDNTQATTLPSAPVNREEYIALVQDIVAEYSAWAGAKSYIDGVDGVSADGYDAARAGAGFLFNGASSSAIYATALSALKKPDDPLIASNLGVVLTQACDYVSAKKAMLYADGLKPNTPLFILNEGWIHYNAGDNTNAKSLFETAVALSPDLSSAKLGLGLLSKQEGNDTVAIDYLRQSLSKEYSSEGARVYLDIVDTLTQAGTPPEVPISSEKATGGIVLPPIEWAGIERWAANYREISDMWMNFANLYLTSSNEAYAHQQDMLNGVWRYEVNPYTDFLLNDVQSVYLGKVDRAWNDFIYGESDNFSQIDLDFISTSQTTIGMPPDQACPIIQAAYKRAYQDAIFFWQPYYAVVRPALIDYYADTTPLLDRVYSQPSNKDRNLIMKSYIYGYYSNMLLYAYKTAGYASGWANMADCPPPPLPQAEALETPVLADTPPSECPTGEAVAGVGLGPLSFEFTCDTYKVSFAAGIAVSYETNTKNNATKLFIGLGGNLDFPATTGFGAVAGMQMIDPGVDQFGDAGYTDIGLHAEVSSKLGIAEGEVAGDLTLMNGPSMTLTPKIMFSPMKPGDISNNEIGDGSKTPIEPGGGSGDEVTGIKDEAAP